MPGEDIPTIASQLEGSSGNQLIDFAGREELRQLILNGQRLQKDASNPALQPSFWEQLLALKGWNLPIQQKAEQRRLLQQQQLKLADYLYKNHHPELLRAVFGKVNDTEGEQLIQAMMNKPRARVGQAMQEELGASVLSNVPATAGLPPGLAEQIAALSQAAPQVEGVAPLTSRPPTMREQAARAPEILQTFLPLLAMAQGKSGDIFKALEENRKQKALASVSGLSSQGAPGRTISLAPGSTQPSTQPGARTLLLPGKPDEPAFEQALARAQAEVLSQTQAPVAGTISPAQAQVDPTTTLTLPPFKIDPTLGMRLGESGLPSRDIFEAKHRSSVEHLTRAVTQDPRLAPYVLEQLSTVGSLTPKDIADIVPFVSQQTFALALRDPSLLALGHDPVVQFQRAKQVAARMLAPPGVTPFPFDPKAVSDFADPVKLAGAITAENERARAGAFAAKPQTPAQVEEQRGMIAADAAGERVTTEAIAKTRAQRGQRLREVEEGYGKSIFYVNTGLSKGKAPLSTIPGHASYGTATDAIDAGEAVPVNQASHQKLQALNNIIPQFQSYLSKLEAVYGKGGIFEKLSAAGRIPATALNTWQALFPNDVALATAKRQADTLISPIARTLSADVGNLAVLEAERYKAAVAQTSGIPDTAEIAGQLSNDLIDSLNAIIANYLELPNQVDQDTGKVVPGYQHPGLRKPTFVHSDIASGKVKGTQVK